MDISDVPLIFSYTGLSQMSFACFSSSFQHYHIKNFILVIQWLSQHCVCDLLTLKLTKQLYLNLQHRHTPKEQRPGKVRIKILSSIRSFLLFCWLCISHGATYLELDCWKWPKASVSSGLWSTLQKPARSIFHQLQEGREWTEKNGPLAVITQHDHFDWVAFIQWVRRAFFLFASLRCLLMKKSTFI